MLQDLGGGGAHDHIEPGPSQLVENGAAHDRALREEKDGLGAGPPGLLLQLETELPFLRQDHRPQARAQLVAHHPLDGLPGQRTHGDQRLGRPLARSSHALARLSQGPGLDRPAPSQQVPQLGTPGPQQGVTDQPVLEIDAPLAVAQREDQGARSTAGADQLQDIRERQVLEAANDAQRVSARRTPPVGQSESAWPPPGRAEITG